MSALTTLHVTFIAVLIQLDLFIAIAQMVMNRMDQCVKVTITYSFYWSSDISVSVNILTTRLKSPAQHILFRMFNHEFTNFKFKLNEHT